MRRRQNGGGEKRIIKKSRRRVPPYRITEPVPFMASTMVYGAFSNIAGAYLSFAGWLQEDGRYRMSGPNRQIVHRGPWNESEPENYLVEIQIPIEKI